MGPQTKAIATVKLFGAFYLIASLQLFSFKSGHYIPAPELLKVHKAFLAERGAQKNILPGIYINQPAAQCDSITDIDGNIYHVVKIGKQCWMRENLRAKHFSDGSVITELEYGYDWPYTGYNGNHGETGMPAWCYYERSPQYNYPYGKLYNWYAVADPRNICPAGWHVPTDSDFQTLSDFLGGDEVSGGHLKDIKLWREKDEKNADDSSGFDALPAGIRYRGGSFDRAGADGADFWSSSPYGRYGAVCRSLYFEGSNFGRHFLSRRTGLSVRCVGD